MNEDPRYLRAALRRRGIPALEKAVGRGVKGSLIRTAALLRTDADFLEALAEEAERGVVQNDGEDVLLRADGLVGLPDSLAGRVVRRALLAQGTVPESAHVEAVIGLATARPGSSVSLRGALKAKREKEYVRLSRSSPRSEGRRRTAARP